MTKPIRGIDVEFSGRTCTLDRHVVRQFRKGLVATRVIKHVLLYYCLRNAPLHVRCVGMQLECWKRFKEVSLLQAIQFQMLSSAGQISSCRDPRFDVMDPLYNF
jgi:hypothetical protein